MSDVFDATPADPIERLARIEGQSNFMAILAGSDVGPDTTEDMAALAFSRASCQAPEVLEAFVAQSGIYGRPLMSLTYKMICDELKPKDKDLKWMRGAVADAFLLIRYGHCKRIGERSAFFRVDNSVYGVVRKVAHGVLLQMIADAEKAWRRARFG